MYIQIVPQLWMLVPKAERDLLAKQFELPRTGITEVIDQTVITDGYRAEDLINITLEKMVAFVGSEESFMRAWELTTMKAHSLLNPPTVFIGTQEELNKVTGVELKEVSNEENHDENIKQEFNPKVEEKENKKGKTKNV